jgi:hypothetical protein
MNFAKRLAKVSKAGLLTTADLSTWFGRPYATVRGWVQGYEPWGPNGEEARRLLVALESAIIHRRGFPVPVHLSPAQRKQHVQKARHEHNGRLPASRAAR